jgi:hypothetical protein
MFALPATRLFETIKSTRQGWLFLIAAMVRTAGRILIALM